MKKYGVFLCTIAGILLLGGCGGNVVDWAKVNFNQTERYQRDITNQIKRYLKSVHLYDQFQTIAKFDALWLSDEVRTIYSINTCRSLGRDEEGTRSFLRRQLSSNEYHISFLVLSLNENPLTTTLPHWTVSLDIDGKRYLPIELKVTEVSAEYRLMLDKLISRHKRPYDIKFDRKDADGKDILEGAQIMKLIFSSPQYFGSLVWYFDESGNVTEPPVVKREKKERKQRSFERRTAGQKISQKQEKRTQRSLGKRIKKESHTEIKLLGEESLVE